MKLSVLVDSKIPGIKISNRGFYKIKAAAKAVPLVWARSMYFHIDYIKD